MITKKNLRLISGFTGSTAFKVSVDTAASSIIQNQLDNAIICSRQLASQISYRNTKFIPYVDTKVNRYFSSTMLLTIVFSKVMSFLDFVNPKLELMSTTVGSTITGTSRPTIKTIIKAVDHALDIASFKNLANILETVTVDDIVQTCDNIADSKTRGKKGVSLCDDYTRIYLAMFKLVAHKIKNSNNAYERTDVIDISSEISKTILMKSYECCEEITLSELITHQAFLPLFNLIITHVHNMNDLIHKPIWDDDDDFIKYSKYVTIYDECLDCVKNFHTHLDAYVEQCVVIQRNIDSYVKLLELNALIKRSSIDDFGVFESFYKTKMKGCLPDVEMKYLSYNGKVPTSISVTSFNDTFDFVKLKDLTIKALNQAKKDCLTYDDISYSIGTYWYRDTHNGKYQLCKAFINDCFVESSQQGQYYTVKCTDLSKTDPVTQKSNYLVNIKNVLTKKNVAGFKRLCESVEQCYHMMKLDGYGKYIGDLNKIVFNGKSAILNLFFEKFRNSKLVKTFEYSDKSKTTIKIEYVDDTLSIRYLEFPNTPDYNRGYDLTGILPVSTTITVPRYRVIGTGSIEGISGDKITITAKDENLKFLLTNLVDDIHVEIEQSKINSDAQKCIKHILDDQITGSEVNLSQVICDEFSQLFTPKIPLFERIFGKKYIFLEDSFFSDERSGNNFVVTRHDGQIKKNCPIIIKHRDLLDHAYDPTIKDKVKAYSFGFNRSKGTLFVDASFEPKPELRFTHANYTIGVDPDQFSFSSKSVHESISYEDGGKSVNGFRKRIYFTDCSMLDMLSHTNDLTYYINAEKVNREKPDMELFNMIAYVTTTNWWSDKYAKMIVNNSNKILNCLKNLLTLRPIFLIDTFYEYKAGTGNNPITGIIDDKNDDDATKLIKLSAYLNSIMSEIKLAFADIDYVIDAVNSYSKFLIQGDPVKTFTMDTRVDMLFDGVQFNIWDVLDVSECKRLANYVRPITTVDHQILAVFTPNNIRPLVYPNNLMPKKAPIKKVTIAGYEYKLLLEQKQNQILELND